MKKRWLYLVLLPLTVLALVVWKNARLGTATLDFDADASRAVLHRPVPPVVQTTTQASTSDEKPAASAVPRPRPLASSDEDRPSLAGLRPFDDRSEQQRRQDFVRKHGTGQTLAVAGVDYEVMRLRAIPAADYDRSSGAAVAERWGYAFLPSDDETLALRGGAFPVVAQKSNGTLGVVTGTLIVGLKDLAAASSLAREHSLRLKYVDQDLLQAYYESPARQPLTDLERSLAQTAGVISVRLEIVQTRKRF